MILPFVVSTSEYNSPAVDWSANIDPPVAAVLARATIGTPNWMGSGSSDRSFIPQLLATMGSAAWLRSAYHFLMNGAGGVTRQSTLCNM